MKTAVAIISLFFLIGGQAAEIPVTNGSKITVSGVLERTWQFGPPAPPNYSEDPGLECVEPYFVLVLDAKHAFKLAEDPKDAGASPIAVSRLQIVFDMRDKDFWGTLYELSTAAKTVTLNGIVAAAGTAHHHEVALLEIRKDSLRLAEHTGQEVHQRANPSTVAKDGNPH